MANNVPLSGLTDAAGGYILPFDQGVILTQGLLEEAGALAIAGDSRTTGTRKETFSIWQGAPTAAFVGEGGTKAVTGAEFAAGTLNIKKVATIVTFTDEMIEDVQSGDLNVLVDSDVRSAIADIVDANALGQDSGGEIVGNFDSELTASTLTVAVGGTEDALQVAVSEAMGSLEANGYSDFGAVVGADVARYIRDRRGGTAETALYGGPVSDPFYGIPVQSSTNLDTITAGGTIGVVASRPNIHVRVRKDVTLSRSTEATVGGTSLWQNDLTAIRYVTRLGMWVHDLDRAVVVLTKA